MTTIQSRVLVLMFLLGGMGCRFDAKGVGGTGTTENDQVAQIASPGTGGVAVRLGAGGTVGSGGSAGGSGGRISIVAAGGAPGGGSGESEGAGGRSVMDAAADAPGGRGSDGPSADRMGTPQGSDAPPLKPGQQGARCRMGDECESGACNDGVCCEFSCTSRCMACDRGRTGVADGLCRPILAGVDPESECTEESPTTCRQNGQCDGKGGCQLFERGTVCGVPACGGNSLRPGSTCDGDGRCLASALTVCPGGLTCESVTACRTRCTTGADCVGPAVCEAGACKMRKPQGDVCAASSDCLSGSCVDGRCCETACNGNCMACANSRTGVADGKCAPATAGTDPDNECAAMEASTCGTDGMCDGAGACRKYKDGTECGSYCCGGEEERCALSCSAGSCKKRESRVVEACHDGLGCSSDWCAESGTQATCKRTVSCGGGGCCCKNANGGGDCRPGGVCAAAGGSCVMPTP